MKESCCFDRDYKENYCWTLCGCILLWPHHVLGSLLALASDSQGGRAWPLGDFVNIYRHSGSYTWGWEGYQHLEVEATDAAKHPAMHRASQDKEGFTSSSMAQNVNSAGQRNPHLGQKRSEKRKSLRTVYMKPHSCSGSCFCVFSEGVQENCSCFLPFSGV